ncbi:hypothetical protein [Nocardia carnea]|uniref:hypothetical protein n=1 Tax=Nocardia carnea TaxID=37328 RepID=UPI00052682B7|nr:hypothetical protein [Nocardia carnea]
MTRPPASGRAGAAAPGPLLFQVTRTAEDTTIATYDEAAALILLRRAARRGFGIQAQRSGGFRIEWQAHRLDTPPASRLITAEPTTPARLTAIMRADLEHIAECRARRRAAGGIRIGLSQIPPAAAARLHARGLLTTPADDPARVVLTLSARLALLAEAHRTSTKVPRGWYRPADDLRPGEWAFSAGSYRPGGKSGMAHDRTSAAGCSCKEFAEFAEDRTDAARRARQHRETVAAALVATL